MLLFAVVVVVVVVVVVLTLTHRYNAVLGHRTGSNNSTALRCSIIAVSWFCDHRACISLGGIGTDTGCVCSSH